jgi:very-short-patch-repair endonuclease
MPSFHPRDTPRARELRRQATPAERRLWRYLCASQLGVKFSRQMPLGPYFADFLCRELSLVVELDGFSHDLRAGYDRARDAWMRAEGYRVVRFPNALVFTDVESIVTAIQMEIAVLRASRPPRCD